MENIIELISNIKQININNLKIYKELKIPNLNNVKITLGEYDNKKIIIKKSLLQDYDLINEAYILQNLKSIFIVNYYGSIIKNDQIFEIVIEYIKGQTLKEYLENKNWENNGFNIDFQKTNKILLQICNGIKYIHEKGFYHNDIKTDNIMIYDNEKIKIIDFGSAGSRDIDHQSGTYTAPEMDNDIYLSLYEKYVIENKLKAYDDFFPVFYDKNDIYCLGFIFWEMFHYPKAPFQDKYTFENPDRVTNICNKIKEGVLKEKVRKDIPNIYRNIIYSCWRYDMFNRIKINKIIKILKKEKKGI